MHDTLKDFTLRVQQMREAQRAYLIQVAAANKTKTAAAMAQAENILEECRRLEKLVDESISLLTMPENLCLNEKLNLNYTTMKIITSKKLYKVFFILKTYLYVWLVNLTKRKRPSPRPIFFYDCAA